MTPDTFLKNVIDPTLRWLPAIGVVASAGNEARLQLLAIAGQESNWTARVQGGGGPAHGFWQFEGGDMSGTAEVLRVAPRDVQRVCDGLGIVCNRPAVYEELAENDMLACAMARLLLHSDPKPLPELGDEDGGWECYVRNWHPGAPSRERWTSVYATSLNLVRTSA
jgi:hypothetical protein